MLIDADLLLNYQRCHRRAFLDTYGDLNQRDAPNDYLLKLMQDSHLNQQSVLGQQDYRKPKVPQGDWAAGAQATLELMQQGVDRIFQGVLLTSLDDGTTLLSRPDLLTKATGQSIFGDWVYVPTEIKLGKRPKLEYQIITAYHTYVLAHVQGAWSETAWLALRERGDYEVDLWEMLPRMQDLLTDCLQMLHHVQEPEVFISRSRCSLCHWFNHCYAIAKTDQHLSLLPGVTAARYIHLQPLQLTTVKALAEVAPTQLEPLPGFGPDATHKLIRQARATLHNQAILIDPAPLEIAVAHLTAAPIPDALPREHRYPAPASFVPTPALPPVPRCLPPETFPIELYFDIEAEPALNLIYLHGVLVVDHLTRTQTFYPLLAERPEDESLVWQQFLDLVWGYPDAPIFHFCPFEVQTVQRLAQLYKTPYERVQPLLTRFVDLHDILTRTVTLPVESYALKQIARWMGFDWRDSTANGAQSIYWYAQWLQTGDRAHLNSILIYNEDDCRATHHIKEWLVAFLQAEYSAARA
jgi:predicted RecB family nuclease